MSQFQPKIYIYFFQPKFTYFSLVQIFLELLHTICHNHVFLKVIRRPEREFLFIKSSNIWLPETTELQCERVMPIKICNLVKLMVLYINIWWLMYLLKRLFWISSRRLVILFSVSASGNMIFSPVSLLTATHWPCFRSFGPTSNLMGTPCIHTTGSRTSVKILLKKLQTLHPSYL